MPGRRPLLSFPTAQAGVLCLAGVCVGLGVNAVRPGGLPLGRAVLSASGVESGAACDAAASIVDIGIDDARVLRASGAAFVDARPAGSYAEGHIAGAAHLPSRGDCPDAERVVAALQRAPLVVVYDADGSCALARNLADRLVARGLADVRVMVGGFPAWKEADHPAESGACEACDTVAGAP